MFTHGDISVDIVPVSAPQCFQKQEFSILNREHSSELQRYTLKGVQTKRACNITGNALPAGVYIIKHEEEAGRIHGLHR